MAEPDLLIVVPARGGSKRLPGKNLLQIGGRTLLAWTADFIREEGLLANAMLSTDDEAIAEAGRRAGLIVPFLRPTELATDTASTTDVVRHALAWRERERGPPDLVAVLQVTSPFRRKGLLNDAIAMLAANPHANTVVGMKKLGFSTQYVFRQIPDGTAISSPNGAGPAWVPTGALYVTRTLAFREQGTLYAAPIVPIETPGVEAIDIDDDLDLKLARMIGDVPR